MNIFQDPTKSVPKSDSQIVRVTMQESQIAGRKDHIPKNGGTPDLSIQHVPNAGTK